MNIFLICWLSTISFVYQDRKQIRKWQIQTKWIKQRTKIVLYCMAYLESNQDIQNKTDHLSTTQRQKKLSILPVCSSDWCQKGKSQYLHNYYES